MGSKSKLNGQVWSRVNSLSAASSAEEKAEVFNLLATSLREALSFRLKGSMFSQSANGADSMKFLRNLLQESSESLSPSRRLVIICHSAIRCTEIIKDLRQVLQRNKIFKAFGKHMKLEEQVVSFQRMDPEIIVGTPDRLNKLFSKLEEEKVNVAEVLIEISTKPLGLLSINDCRMALIDLLYSNSALIPSLDAAATKITLF